MKTTLTILAAVMSLAFCSCGSKPAEKEKTTKPAVDTMAVMVMQVQRCSKLYTTEYRVHKVLTHDDKLEMKGKLAGHDYNIPVPLGKRKVAIPIDDTIKAYIDFASFSSDNVQRDSTHIRITLPDPHIVLTWTASSATSPTRSLPPTNARDATPSYARLPRRTSWSRLVSAPPTLSCRCCRSSAIVRRTSP